MTTIEPLVEGDPTLVDVPPTGRARPARPGRALLHGRGLVGLALIGFVVLLAVLGPLLTPYGPTQQIDGANLLDPSWTHPLGTDTVNRDLLSRLVHGIRVDLWVIFLAVPAGALLGSLLGLVASLWSATDVAAQRLFDLVLAFPALILGIALAALMGPGALTVAVVIVVAEVPVFGRLIRSAVLTVRELPYVEASRVIGAGNGWVLRRHVLPNSLEPVTVQLALSMSIAVFIEGAMSFLGLGVRQPDPSLGSLIRDAVTNVYSQPLMGLAPLTVVAALVLGFLLVSQALGEARRG